MIAAVGYVPPNPSWLFFWGSWPDTIVSSLGLALILVIAILFWKSH
jgi:hypothetical protein